MPQDFMSQFYLDGKTALITGAAGYFGRRFVQGLLDARAAKVVIIEKEGVGPDFRYQLDQIYGSRIAWYENNLADDDETDATYGRILQEHDCPDVLVNNAFIFGSETGFTLGRRAVIAGTTHEEFRQCFEAGLWWAVQGVAK